MNFVGDHNIIYNDGGRRSMGRIIVAVLDEVAMNLNGVHKIVYNGGGQRSIRLIVGFLRSCCRELN